MKKHNKLWTLLITAILITTLMTSATFAAASELSGEGRAPSNPAAYETGAANTDEGTATDPDETGAADPDEGGTGDDEGGDGEPQGINIEEVAEIGDIPAVTYTGKQHKPAVAVNGDGLEEGICYTVSYGENINAGTGMVTVTGIGSYFGTLTKEFTIEPKTVTPTLTLSRKSYAWNNKAHKPKVTVKIGNTVLKPSDYKLIWSKGRKNVGTYYVTAELKGNYSGKKKAGFRVIPKRTTISGLNATSESVHVKWGMQATKMSSSRIRGYQLEYSRYKTFKSGKRVNVKGYNKTSRWLTNLKSSTKYYVRIRTYSKVNDKTYYSAWSAAESVKTTAYKPKILVFDNDQDNQRVVRMLNNNGCRAEMLWADNIDVSKYDGIVIPGGHNIDPRMYGAARAPETYGINIDKDKAQISMLKKFAKAKKPVLGLCRGCQVINVAYGGTICQHIPGWHKWDRTVTIKKGSWLYNAYGAKSSVYHFHHQCVEKLGSGLVATQWDASDGRIEAVEHKTLPVYGVQWHPDTMEEKGNAVFREFRKVCIKQRESN